MPDTVQAWKLETVRYQQPDETLAEGTEAEVKAAAGTLFTAAYADGDTDRARVMFCDLFLTKPDGSHQGIMDNRPGFNSGDMPVWADVAW